MLPIFIFFSGSFTDFLSRWPEVVYDPKNWSIGNIFSKCLVSNSHAYDRIPGCLTVYKLPTFGSFVVSINNTKTVCVRAIIKIYLIILKVDLRSACRSLSWFEALLLISNFCGSSHLKFPNLFDLLNTSQGVYVS